MLIYKNSGLRLSFCTIMSMCVHNYFKQMISFSNFVLISLLAAVAVAVLIKFCFEPSVVPQ